MQYMIEMENGSSGAILPEKMSYSFANGRIKIVKNGETVLDREITISPSNNYCVDVGDEVDIKPAEEAEEFFGFGKKNNDQLSQAKNNTVNSLNNIAGDIDAEKKLRETMKAKLMAGKTGVAKEEFNVGNMLPIGQGANGGITSKEGPFTGVAKENIGVIPNVAPDPMLQQTPKCDVKLMESVNVDESELKDFSNAEDAAKFKGACNSYARAKVDRGIKLCELGIKVAENKTKLISPKYLKNYKACIKANKEYEKAHSNLLAVINSLNAADKAKAKQIIDAMDKEIATEISDKTGSHYTDKLVEDIYKSIGKNFEKAKDTFTDDEKKFFDDFKIESAEDEVDAYFDTLVYEDSKDGYITTMIDSFKKAMKKEWSKTPKNEKKLKELKTKLTAFCNKNNVAVPNTGVAGLVAASYQDDTKGAIINEYVSDIYISPDAIDFIKSDNDIITEGVFDSVIVYNSNNYLTPMIKKDILVGALLRAKHSYLTEKAKLYKDDDDVKSNDPLKAVCKAERSLITNTKQYREDTKGMDPEAKKEIAKIKTEAVNAVKDYISKLGIHYVEEKVSNPPDNDTRANEAQAAIDAKRAEIKKLTDEYKKAPAADKSDIKEKIKNLNKEVYDITNRCKKDGIAIKECASYLDYVSEKANIDEDIKSILEIFNRKGYKTKYSSAGHEHLRKKEDSEPDGVYYGKLYSDARVQFTRNYRFPKAPDYWHWRKVDGCDYLDITPITYDSKDGSPDEAFSKWKKNYLDSLRKFAESLPDAGKANDGGTDGKDVEDIKQEGAIGDFARGVGDGIKDMGKTMKDNIKASAENVLDKGKKAIGAAGKVLFPHNKLSKDNPNNPDNPIRKKAGEVASAVSDAVKESAEDIDIDLEFEKASDLFNERINS